MNFKRILGIIICLCGIGLVGVSFYIKNWVAEGQIEIAEGQKKIDRTKSLFSIVPETKELGNKLTESGQNRVNQGEQQVAEYSALAHKLQIGGIVLIVVGIGLAFLGRNRK